MLYFDMLQSEFLLNKQTTTDITFNGRQKSHVVLQKSKLFKDKRDDYGKADDIYAIEEELVKQIWIMIENDEIWHDAHVQAEVSWNLLKSV